MQLRCENSPTKHHLSMNTIHWASLFSLFALPVFGQTTISGTINQYAKVLGIELCEARLTVDNGNSFQPGDHLLLIQMKGATINESNNSSFGNIQNLGSSGFYEKNEVLAVVGNEVFLKYEITQQYDITGAVQLVSVPFYSDVIVNGELVAKPWDGQTGGIVAIEATSIELQADINASGAGFRGAPKVLVSSDCDFLTNADSYYYSTTNWRGSPKGEGIAAFVQDKEHGRGAQLNGGGGGNDHNSGGGGGANITEGGVGGKQNTSGFGCDGDYAGKGGKPCPDDPERIFLGGGGGAGHFDNNGAGSPGANGGGIAILISQTIIANGKSIRANGNNALQAQGDGAGGGGGGGTVILSANTIEGQLTIEAKGGKGGNTVNTSSRCNGVGGGGGGGHFLTNIASTLLQVDLSAGQPGEHQGSLNECSGTSNGALAGAVGVQSPLTALPFSGIEVQPLAVQIQPSDVIVCINDSFSVNFILTGSYLTYQWQVESNGTWSNLNNLLFYNGVQSPVLSVSQAVPSMDGKRLRCIVSSPCSGEIVSNEILMTVLPVPVADFSAIFLGSGTYQFQNNSTGADSYFWDFGNGQTSQEESPVYTYPTFGDFTVTLTISGPCGNQNIELELEVDAVPIAGFTFQNNGECAPQTVEFLNLSSSNAEGFEWLFPGGSPAFSTEISPVVSYQQAGVFDVVLIAFNGSGSDTTVIEDAIEVGDVPTALFDLTVSNLQVNFNNLSLYATGGFVWDFGDGSTSTDINPIHTYDLQGIYQVTLTASNACGSASYSISVPTGSLPLALFSADQVIGCTPFEVSFENQSSGINISSYQWEFPGGNPAFSTEENPIVTYSSPGSFPVFLTVTNPLGSHTQNLANYIQVTESPIAAFDFTIQGNSVQFDNLSEGANYYHWDFGDGSSSDAFSPLHVYESLGTFNVMLTVGNLNCGGALSSSIYLQPSLASGKVQPKWTISPNPFESSFRLLYSGDPNQLVRIRLLDMDGRVVISAEDKIIDEPIDVHFLKAGVYIAEIWGNQGRGARVKVVKL